MENIQIEQRFNASPQAVFNTLCDHEMFGKLIGANIVRTRDGENGFANGKGSIRRITVLPGLSFEETVVTFEPYECMEYTITKGSPIKNHHGSLVFTDSDGGTLLTYNISFSPKLPLPLIGKVLKKAIEDPIRKGLRSLAASYG